ncbi:MAG: hypothetical protein LT106_18510 [Burkholderiaceae bacterium]|nr:hypothetical protein [Burkholderiaceae bacterium]
MIYLHAEPIGWTLRLYDEPDGFARRVPYQTLVATVTIMGARASIWGLHGRFDRDTRRAIAQWLHEQGVTSAEMERHGRIITLTDEEQR